MTIPGILEEKLSAALKAVLGEELPADFCASVTPSADLRFGDYQSNAAMVLAKRCRTNPRALAQQVVAWSSALSMVTIFCFAAALRAMGVM